MNRGLAVRLLVFSVHRFLRSSAMGIAHLLWEGFVHNNTLFLSFFLSFFLFFSLQDLLVSVIHYFHIDWDQVCVSCLVIFSPTKDFSLRIMIHYHLTPEHVSILCSGKDICVLYVEQSLASIFVLTCKFLLRLLGGSILRGPRKRCSKNDPKQSEVIPSNPCRISS